MDGFPINYADLIVFAVIVLSGVFALVRGFVHEFLTLGAWIGAGIATYYGIDHVIPVARQLTTIQPLADIGSGTAIFLVVLIALSILTRLASRRIRHSAFGALDRSLGLIFGLVRGAFLVAIGWLVFAWAFHEEDYPEWIAEARTLPLVQHGAKTLYDVLPEGLRPEDLPPGLDLGSIGSAITKKLTGVPPSKATVQDERTGYKDEERKGLQGLVEQNQ
ncbi:MAG: CvpA family protein [Kiloniellales bacterium]